ncbi:hypothetical protein B0T21DRAFT_353721 [Apiosordaria backusii]|uniref:DUF6594 domain-containing protein n=1 Tax=Apiosordaria backusii TaxID=314023 RepID=A0AA39ZPW5_9PEZI|nr:hypothetical protein B0T21DRAFT_353721 [Apiosordaria backusii]
MARHGKETDQLDNFVGNPICLFLFPVLEEKCIRVHQQPPPRRDSISNGAGIIRMSFNKQDCKAVETSGAVGVIRFGLSKRFLAMGDGRFEVLFLVLGSGIFVAPTLGLNILPCIFTESKPLGSPTPTHRIHARMGSGSAEEAQSQAVYRGLPRRLPPFLRPHGRPRLLPRHPALLPVATRLLLLKQDRVSELEEKLHKIDRDETRKLFLGNRRRDRNEEMLSVIAELTEALKSRPSQPHHLHAHAPARVPRDVASLQNWHNSNPSITRTEMAFLEREEDLMSLSSPANSDVLPAWVERAQKIGDIERSIGVHLLPTINSPLRTRNCNIDGCETRGCNYDYRGVSVDLVNFLSTRGKMLELVVAGATYTTVLVVFITGPGGGGAG